MNEEELRLALQRLARSILDWLLEEADPTKTTTKTATAQRHMQQSTQLLQAVIVVAAATNTNTSNTLATTASTQTTITTTTTSPSTSPSSTNARTATTTTDSHEISMSRSSISSSITAAPTSLSLDNPLVLTQTGTDHLEKVETIGAPTPTNTKNQTTTTDTRPILPSSYNSHHPLRLLGITGHHQSHQENQNTTITTTISSPSICQDWTQVEALCYLIYYLHHRLTCQMTYRQHFAQTPTESHGHPNQCLPVLSRLLHGLECPTIGTHQNGWTDTSLSSPSTSLAPCAPSSTEKPIPCATTVNNDITDTNPAHSMNDNPLPSVVAETETAVTTHCSSSPIRAPRGKQLQRLRSSLGYGTTNETNVLSTLTTMPGAGTSGGGGGGSSSSRIIVVPTTTTTTTNNNNKGKNFDNRPNSIALSTSSSASCCSSTSSIASASSKQSSSFSLSFDEVATGTNHHHCQQQKQQSHKTASPKKTIESKTLLSPMQTILHMQMRILQMKRARQCLKVRKESGVMVEGTNVTRSGGAMAPTITPTINHGTHPSNQHQINGEIGHQHRNTQTVFASHPALERQCPVPKPQEQAHDEKQLREQVSCQICHCTFKRCRTLRRLFAHVKHCANLPDDLQAICAFPYCSGTKKALSHHQNCRVRMCPICVPVKVVWSRDQRQLVSSSSSLSSLSSKLAQPAELPPAVREQAISSSIDQRSRKVDVGLDNNPLFCKRPNMECIGNQTVQATKVTKELCGLAHDAQRKRDLTTINNSTSLPSFKRSRRTSTHW